MCRKTSYPTSLSPHQRDGGGTQEKEGMRKEEKRRDAKRVEKGQFNFYYVFAVSIVFHTHRAFVRSDVHTDASSTRATRVGKAQGL